MKISQTVSNTKHRLVCIHFDFFPADSKYCTCRLPVVFMGTCKVPITVVLPSAGTPIVE